MKWNTKEIVNDLTNLIEDKGKVSTENSPQGECYCRDIFIETGKDEDGISIIGFNDDGTMLSDVDQPDEEVELVEVRNFYSDSDGGLDKGASKKVRELYYIVIDYFNEKDISIVDNLRDHF